MEDDSSFFLFIHTPTLGQMYLI